MPIPSPGASPVGREAWPLLNPRTSLRARAAVVLGGVGLLATLAVLWAGGALLEQEIAARTGTALESRAIDAADKISRTLYDRHLSLRYAALLPSFQPAAGAEARRTAVDALLDAVPDFAWVGFVDTEGTILTASQRLFEGDRVTSQPWFRAGQREPRAGTLHDLPQLSRAIDAAGSGASQFMELTVPVTTSQGAATGVLVAYLGASSLRPILGSFPAAPGRDSVAVTVYAGTGEPLLDSESSDWTQPPEAPAPALSGGRHGYFYESVASGQPFITGYARVSGVRDFRGPGWIVAARQPAGAVFAPIARLRWQLLAGGIVVSAGLAMLGVWLMAPVSRELRRIAAASRRIEEGDVLAMLPSPSDAGELARACAALRRLVEWLRRGDLGEPRSSPGREAPVAHATDAERKQR